MKTHILGRGQHRFPTSFDCPACGHRIDGARGVSGGTTPTMMTNDPHTMLVMICWDCDHVLMLPPDGRVLHCPKDAEATLIPYHVRQIVLEQRNEAMILRAMGKRPKF